jgi:pimeloyl-ACP methyl ester carboxylesterase
MTAPKNAAAASSASLRGQARTVIYCHGISNMPAEGVLRSEWDHALFGANQGERTRMAYWVDRERYPETAVVSTRAIGEDRASLRQGSEALLAASIQQSDAPGESEAFVASLTAQLEAAAQTAAHRGAAMGGPAARSVEAKGLWSPVTAMFTQAFMADVNDFLFNKEKRERMVQTVKDRISTGGGPFVVVGHSQGSMVTYQALLELSAEAPVDLYVTIGSPLGLPQVTDVLQKWHGKKTLPIPTGVKRWVNIAQGGDIVCLDQSLADEYGRAGKPKIVDERLQGMVWPPSKAHSASGYLARRSTQETVLAALDRSRFQPVSPITVTRSLSEALDIEATARVPVLIELLDGSAEAAEPRDSLETARSAVLSWIRSNVLKKPITADTIALEDQLDRYVAANLTRAEVERLAAALGQQYGGDAPAVYRLFGNSRKRALMHDSIHTVQARTAQLGYNACGQGITWAVLDTGIDSHHPHFHNPAFAVKGTVAADWDCTARGAVRGGSQGLLEVILRRGMVPAPATPAGLAGP